jgi:hypothetical protein
VRRPPILQPPYAGGCLCGAVRYRLDARPLGLNACHCDDCKRLSGATNLLMVLALRADFHHQRGAVDRYRKRADSGRDVDIVRCKNCGVRLWHEPLSGTQFVFVAAGTLDDSRWVVPTSHIWIEKASPHIVMEEDALKVEGQPKEREALFKAFRSIYGDG